jgi:hypothetical protein
MSENFIVRETTTPFRAIKIIEEQIGRKFEILEIGWFYHTIHMAIQDIDEPNCILTYDDVMFTINIFEENRMAIACFEE